MREIKFRGKRIDNGEWVYGNYVKDFRMGYTYINVNYENSLKVENYAVEPETVGQYTGLKGKNGKEIYEGDVILVEEGIKKDKYIIEFLNYGWYPFTDLVPSPGAIEIISSIHTTPELLKEQP